MDEYTVIKAVRNWIKIQHPSWSICRAWHFDVVAGPSRNQPCIAVECKGGSSKRGKAHAAVGQCLDYMSSTTFSRIPCFTATPTGFMDNEVILRTLEFHKLPIGLLNVDDNGEVIILRESSTSTN